LRVFNLVLRREILGVQRKSLGCFVNPNRLSCKNRVRITKEAIVGANKAIIVVYFRWYVNR